MKYYITPEKWSGESYRHMMSIDEIEQFIKTSDWWDDIQVDDRLTAAIDECEFYGYFDTGDEAEKDYHETNDPEYPHIPVNFG